jgi:peroxiredoxin
MTYVTFAARLILIAVFAVAALSKLRDRRGTREAVVNMGLPAVTAPVVSIALPLIELAIAVLLSLSASVKPGALAAAGLLLAFTVLVAVNLALGRTPDCNCFGEMSSSPIGWRTMVRNVVLAGLAALVAWRGSSVPHWPASFTTADRATFSLALAGFLLLILLSLMLFNLLRQNGRILLRLEALEQGQPAAAQQPGDQGLPVGSPAPTFALQGLHGETLTLDALRAEGKPVMLVFSDPNCGPCNELMPEIAAWQRNQSTALTVAVLTKGSPKLNRDKAHQFGLGRVLIQPAGEVAASYQAVPTPSAVLVRTDGMIGSPVTIGAPAIRALVAQVCGPGSAIPLVPAPHVHQGGGNGSASRKGDQAPAIELPNLKGETVSLEAYRGHDTLLLFWRPSCGFCQQMLDDLKAWERERPADAAEILLVSTGTVEENSAMGLTSEIVLEPAFSVGFSYGVTGTPSAVLVDGEGRIASEVAVGAPAALALARDGHP